MRGGVLIRCFEWGNFGNGKLGNLFQIDHFLYVDLQAISKQ